jgi:hypothetical protein
MSKTTSHKTQNKKAIANQLMQEIPGYHQMKEIIARIAPEGKN